METIVILQTYFLDCFYYFSLHLIVEMSIFPKKFYLF